mgnify:CR=1 FL=1
MFKDYMVNESSEFSTMENNPMIFTLIIPRFITCNDVKTIKEDKVLKNAVDKVEKFIKTLSNKAVKELKQSNKPYAVMDMFKLSKNYKDTFDKYFAEYKSIICNTETNFIKCMELDKKFNELFDSPELVAYRNTL